MPSRKAMAHLAPFIDPFLLRNMPANYAAGTFEQCLGDSGLV
jgi:hypothetical protein